MLVFPKYVNAFVLRLPEKQEKILREQIKDFYTRPANLRKKVILHVGLLIIYLDQKKTMQMLNFLRTWKPNFPKIEVFLGALEKIGDNYIGFSVSSPLLTKIHREILESVKYITAGCYDAKYLSHPLTDKQKEHLETYGYHRVKEYFEPHITIGKYIDEKTRNKEFRSAPRLSGKLTFTELVFDRAKVNSGIPAELLWKLPLE